VNPMNNQFAALSLFELTGNIDRVTDEPVDNVVVPEDPVAAFVEEAQLAVSLGKNGKPDWDSADKIITVNSTPSKTDTALHKSDVEKPHPDGVQVEKFGNQTWHYHYKDGSLIRQEVEDPDLPGDGRMVFDAEGNQLHAAA